MRDFPATASPPHMADAVSSLFLSLVYTCLLIFNIMGKKVSANKFESEIVIRICLSFVP